MNVNFTKDGQTRFVKIGFSWTIFFFGALAFLHRAQYKLALGFFLATKLVYLVAGFIALLVVEEIGPAQVIGLIVASAVAGYVGNKYSGRNYVKNGWTPDANFPVEWNNGLLPTMAADH